MRKLTQDELDVLPDGAEIIVTWSGGNGPHRYRWRVRNGIGAAWLLEEPTCIVGYPNARDYPLDEVWIPAHRDAAFMGRAFEVKK